MQRHTQAHAHAQNTLLRHTLLSLIFGSATKSGWNLCMEKGKGGKRIVLFSRCIRGSRTKHACNPNHTNAAIVCRSHISPHRLQLFVVLRWSNQSRQQSFWVAWGNEGRVGVPTACEVLALTVTPCRLSPTRCFLPIVNQYIPKSSSSSPPSLNSSKI